MEIRLVLVMHTVLLVNNNNKKDIFFCGRMKIISIIAFIVRMNNVKDSVTLHFGIPLGR